MNILPNAWQLLRGTPIEDLRIDQAEWTKLYRYFVVNRLEGHIFENYSSGLPEPIQSNTRLQWQDQWERNLYYLKERKTLSEKFSQLSTKVIFLKGAALLEYIYPSVGARFMCDMDILVDRTYMPQVREILLAQDYQEAEIHKWEGTEFRYVFTKIVNGLTLAVEVHTRLFFYEPKDWNWQSENKNSLERLTPEYQLIHLAGHYGYQHTFLLLHWMMDIYHLVRIEKSRMDWSKVKKLAMASGQYRNLLYIFLSLDKYMGLAIPDLFQSDLKKKYFTRKSHEILFSDSFHWNATGNKWRYFLIKHLTKDSLVKSLVYDFQWLKGGAWH